MPQAPSTDAYSHSVALRLRVAHLMDTVTFDPPGMPPSAILVVRRVSDPLPRKLMSHPEALRSSPEWERAARDRLGDIYRCAVRPAHGVISGNADAVLFSDHAEMLACLASDLLNGKSSLWWWKAILRTLPHGTVEALVAAWRRDARYLPAVFNFLSQRGEAARILASLSPTYALDLFEELAHEFELRLSSTPAPFSSVINNLPSASAPISAATDNLQSINALGTSGPERRHAPWWPTISTTLVPESLGRERSALLGVSLLLHRATEVARSSRFAAAFATWYDSWESNPHRFPTLSEKESAQVASYDTGLPSSNNSSVSPDEIKTGNEILSRDPIVFEYERSPRSTMPIASHEDDARQDQKSAARFSAAFLPTSVKSLPDVEQCVLTMLEKKSPLETLVNTQQATGSKQDSPVLPSPDFSPLEIFSPLQSDDTSLLPTFSHSAHEDEPVLTKLGGVFFLLNLLRALKLPGILESEFGVSGINGWELIELLARCLLGKWSALLSQDPIWQLLAELAQRPADFPAGAEFQGQKSYSLPREWIQPDSISLSTFGIRLRERRLQVWHKDGFLLLDYAAENPLLLHATRLAIEPFVIPGSSVIWTSWRNVAPQGCSACAPLDMKLNNDLRRFLAFILPYVRWRLSLDLGVRTDTRLTETLLLRQAHVFTTSSHVDVIMDLNSVTAPVRMSGLDANPGWVPDLGRVVKFNFTQESWL